jgi:hypothetical protein
MTMLGATELTAELLARDGWPVHTHPVTDGVEAMAFLCGEGKYSRALRPHLICWMLRDLGRTGGPSFLRSNRIVRLNDTYRSFQFVGTVTDISRCWELG